MIRERLENRATSGLSLTLGAFNGTTTFGLAADFVTVSALLPAFGSFVVDLASISVE